MRQTESRPPKLHISMRDTMIDLVVAHYREDLCWLDAFESEPDFRVIVYTKGSMPKSSPYELHMRPNVGREAETWLYHIATRYDSLADYTVFLQGHPFDHTEIPLTPNSLRQAVCSYFPLRSLYRESPNAFPIVRSREYAELLFQVSPPTFSFSPGAQYILSRDRIKRRPLAFYARLHAMALAEPATSQEERPPVSPDTIDAWTLERLWPLVWCESE